MKIFNCLIILALIVAVSATACHKRAPRKHRHCKAIDRSWYFPPKHSSKKALNVFAFVAKGLKSTLKNAIGIFNFYARRVIPRTVQKALEAVLNIAKAISFVLNVWINTIGTIFANIVMAISKIIFCVLGSPWKGSVYFDRLFTHKSCKAPAICGKDYGRRFGWGRFSGKYDSYRDILEFYGLVDLDIDLVIKKHNGVGIKGLVGTKLLVANTIVSLYKLLLRDLKHWKRDDIVLANRYVITVAAALGKGYHADVGLDIVDGFFLFINGGFKSSGFIDISTYRNDIVKDLDTCSAESWNGAIVPLYENDDDDNNNGGNKGGHGNNNNNASNDSDKDKNNNGGNNNNNNGGNNNNNNGGNNNNNNGGNNKNNNDGNNDGHTSGGSKGNKSKTTSVKKGSSKTSTSSNAENESNSFNKSNDASANAAAAATATNSRTSNENGSTVNENSSASGAAASQSESKSSEQSSFNKSSSSSSSSSEFQWEEFTTEEETHWDSS